MITNINKFIELLEKLNLLFSENLGQNLDNEINLTKEIEAFYLEYKHLFPLDIKSSFDELKLQYNSAFEMTVWGWLKEVYFNYENFIKNDYEIIQNSNYTISEDNRKLFYHSKRLSGDSFRFISKFYYWHFGRYGLREKSPIRVFFLNDYQRGHIHFDSDLSNEEIIKKIELHYAFKYELIEREVRYIYSTNDISLEIEQPEYNDENPTNNDLKRLNLDYQSKLEILKNFKANIVKITNNLEFEFPAFLIIENTNPKIKFEQPIDVFNSLKPLLSMSEFEESLRKLIFGETSKIDAGININLKSNELANVFKYLDDINYIKCNNKSDIIDFLTDNFKYRKAGKYTPVKKEGIKKNILTQSSISQIDLPRNFKIELPA